MFIVAHPLPSSTPRFHREQKANPDHRFALPEDFAVVFAEAAGEMVVGGVFLRLFISNPAWVLRKPKEFLVELLEKWCTLTATNSPNVRMIIFATPFKKRVGKAFHIHLTISYIA